MGVQGLWKIVGPVARPITLESLENKRLAIDASIWLYQFQMAMRDRKTGDTLHGAHIMGTFRRILKLLFHGIKPVFVFDGDAPMLKKRTIEKRKRRKQGAGRDLAQTAQKLLSAQLRSAVAERELNKRRKEKLDAAKAAGGADPNMDTGEQVGDNAVYLEDLDKPASPVKAVRKDALRDEYALPRIEGPLESRAKMSDPRIATEEELREFIDDLRPEDLDLESDFFSTLPTEVKYEILGDLRIKTRQVNHRRVQQMRGATAIDFSRAQIDHLMERNTYTQKLFSVTDELGKSAIAIPTRVAGSRNREYVLVKQDASKGGGWVLGVKNPEIHNTEPITIDTTTDESVGGHTDTDEFDEVVAPADTKVGLPTPDVQARRALAEEAVLARFAAAAPGPAADPYLDQPIASTSRGTGLFQHDAQVDEDVALQQALYESAQAAVSPDYPPRPLPLPPAPRPFTSSASSAPLRQPLASTSRAISVANPAPPPPARPAYNGGDDTDDDFEYVSVPIGRSNTATPAPAPLPSNLPVAMDTDDEGSDAFEEVSVVAPPPRAPPSAAPARPSATGPAPLPPAPIPPSRPPSAVSVQQAARPPALPVPPSPPPAAAPSRGLLDSILPSDSESESEASPRKPAPRPLPPARAPDAPAFSRLSPSPDPFERFEQPEAASVQAVDFAAVPPPRSPSPPPADVRSPTPQRPARSPSPRVIYEADLLALPPVAAAPSAALQSRPTSPPAQSQVDARAPSPASMPAPLPPLEKAREAVEAEEARVLPATVAQLGAPAPGEGDEAMREASPSASLPGREKGKGRAEEGREVDELFFSDWSRSPSPPPQERASAAGEASPAAGPDGAAESTEWYYDLNDEEEAEALQVLEREEEAFADVMAQLRNEKIEKMRAEAEKDVMQLSEQRNVEMRNADGVTRQMAVDIKEMLILFGIPYVDAPMEAEAECASLLTRELVDGIVTDDSDVFLFGGTRIYRNMFNESKYVECYLSADLEREIGLDRDKLVRLAYLLGSDYTEGLPGVGPVAGRELLEEFPGQDGLRRFSEWWDRVQSGKDSELETNTAWKRRFKKGHKELILDKGWPNPEIAQAYYRPTVDESNEQFTWGGVDLDGLRFYLNRSLGWPQSKSDQLLLPLIKREQERKAGALKKQPIMTDFFDYTAGYEPFSRSKQPKYASKRLQNVVQQWKEKAQPKGKGKADDDEDADEAELEQAPPAKKKRARKASTAKATRPNKSTAASRKRAEKEARAARANANGGEFSSEEDLRSDREKKEDGEEGQRAPKKTRTQPARRGSARRMKVVAAPSSDEDDE